MPRGVVDLEGQPAHLQLVSLFQVPVHGWRRGALQTEPTRLLLQIPIQELILLVQVDGDVPCLPHSLDTADVVQVGVSVDDGEQGKFLLVDSVEQLRSLVARIDVDRLRGIGTAHDVPVFKKRFDSMLVDDRLSCHIAILP